MSSDIEPMIRGTISQLLGDGHHTRLVRALAGFGRSFEPGGWLAASHALDELFESIDAADHHILRGTFAAYLIGAMARSYGWYANPTQRMPYNLAPHIYRNIERKVLRIYNVSKVGDLVDAVDGPAFDQLKLLAAQIAKYQ